MNTHYQIQRRQQTWGFTSPLGSHFASFTRREADMTLNKVRLAHRLRADGDGHEAAILRAWFERHEVPETTAESR